jgi:hypothetical protein
VTPASQFAFSAAPAFPWAGLTLPNPNYHEVGATSDNRPLIEKRIDSVLTKVGVSLRVLRREGTGVIVRRVDHDLFH